MVSWEEGMAQVEYHANRRKQKDAESDHAYVMRRVNEFSPQHKHYLHLTPCETFTSTRGNDEEIIPPGFLVGIEKARFVGPSKMLPSTDVARKLKHALRQAGLHDTGVSQTSKGVWVGHDTVARLHSAVTDPVKSSAFLENISEKEAGVGR